MFDLNLNNPVTDSTVFKFYLTKPQTPPNAVHLFFSSLGQTMSQLFKGPNRSTSSQLIWRKKAESMEQKVTILSNSTNNLCGSWMMFVDHRNLLDFQHQKAYHPWTASFGSSDLWPKAPRRMMLGQHQVLHFYIADLKSIIVTCSDERKVLLFVPYVGSTSSLS